MKKKCSQCFTEKLLTNFAKDSRNKSGLRAYCKECCKITRNKYYLKNAEKVRQINLDWKIKNKEKYRQSEKLTRIKKVLSGANAQNKAKYKAAKLQAMPLWFEKERVAFVYKKAKEYGFEVDHVIPLQGKNVCGLHCWANLQLLDKNINASKNNVQYPDT